MDLLVPRVSLIVCQMDFDLLSLYGFLNSRVIQIYLRMPRVLRLQLRFQLPIVIVLLSNSELASLYGFLNSKVIQMDLLLPRVSLIV